MNDLTRRQMIQGIGAAIIAGMVPRFVPALVGGTRVTFNVPSGGYYKIIAGEGITVTAPVDWIKVIGEPIWLVPDIPSSYSIQDGYIALVRS